MRKSKVIEQAVDSIERHEGFEEQPYPDPIHGWNKPTFGHGLTYITREESDKIVKDRVRKLYSDMKVKKPFFATLPGEAKAILIEMAYQLGLSGLMRFRHMWLALEEHDFKKAAQEMRDSLWYRQTRSRAEELASRMEKIDGNKR